MRSVESIHKSIEPLNAVGVHPRLHISNHELVQSNITMAWEETTIVGHTEVVTANPAHDRVDGISRSVPPSSECEQEARERVIRKPRSHPPRVKIGVQKHAIKCGAEGCEIPSPEAEAILTIHTPLVGSNAYVGEPKVREELRQSENISVT